MRVSKPATVIALFLFSNFSGKAQQEVKVDYSAFLNISKELVDYRASRLIDIEKFNVYSSEENTIILDTRSKAAYDKIHIEGAIHLNFSDFTEDALAKVVKDKNTRLLIYCNNNFKSSRKALMNKMTPLALNIPTFINLYGYGYTNIYELDEYLDENDPRVTFEISDKKQIK